MKSILTILIALMLYSQAWAQETFEKYYLAVGTWSFNVIELGSANFLTDMAYANPDSVIAAGTSMLDREGVPIHSHTYAVDSFLVLQSVRKYSDNEFYFVTSYYGDTCYFQQGFAIRHFYPVIAKIDSMGNVLNARRYVLNDGCQNNPGDLEVTHDGSVITWGREWSFFALKADSNLAHVWSKRFTANGGIQFIKELPGGDLLAGINMDTAGVVVARMDPAGNFLWCKSYIRPRGIIHDCIVESDSSFILTGFTDSVSTTFGPLPPGYHPKLFMMKLDGSGGVQWCKGYDNPALLWYVPKGLYITQTLDGQYAVLATLAGHPLLMKTDLNGDTLWTRSAGVSGYSYVTSGLLSTSDGGLLYNGSVAGDLGSWSDGSYLFKADSLGHLPCSERSAPVISISDLFPVDSSFTLTTVDGALDYPAYLNDTTASQIITYNGCTITSVQDPVHTHAIKPSIHPNPSSGHFTMDFPDPLTVDSFYSVYDATGRLLFQRPLTKSAETVEIDLSSYGKGMYLIRFSDRDGVCAERVVVE